MPHDTLLVALTEKPAILSRDIIRTVYAVCSLVGEKQAEIAVRKDG